MSIRSTAPQARPAVVIMGPKVQERMWTLDCVLFLLTRGASCRRCGRARREQDLLGGQAQRPSRGAEWTPGLPAPPPPPHTHPELLLWRQCGQDSAV